MKNPKVPLGLKTPGKKFWKKVLSEYELSEAHDLERLRHACTCLDEIDEFQKIIQNEGRMINNREHPASKALREYKVLFSRILREIGLDLAVSESRIPRKY